MSVTFRLLQSHINPLPPIVHTGEWADDFRNGQGKYTYTNGDAYEGEWSNNLRHGKGSYTFSSTGAKYVGNWINGRKEGPGEFLYANFRYNGLFTGDQVREMWSC